MTSIADRRREFRRLHESGCFVIPNPWDVGSARYLASAGFKALATTSAGAAWTLGYADGKCPEDEMLAHIASIVNATNLPVNADFEGGHSDSPDDIGGSVTRCIETGVAGLSIEDYTNDKDDPIYDFDLAVARIKSARLAVDRAGGDVLLVGRAEGLIRNRPDFDEIIRRLDAYSSAGADCLYAPGIATAEQIAAVVKVAGRKPVNVLMGAPSKLSVKDLEELGVRRISVGGSLARSAWGGFVRAVKTITEQGTFDGFKDAMPGVEINKLLSQ
ncbi:carboxyvinyl-carboxyphosphonate phosphorylmutase [Variibacter gotjawalensis]|uniref:Carboxyvinyl-carboxyphosphonate phosphorylmutase n=1 Tax=Variibacter gotjawalensis TaxID=1333996 RepID=A0A0S3PP64_9BRAD|nr:isocitrate lyase/phosphoenolpyruvate mutase family protein [Variibacter gotjawalensis]NIK47970.1 2-methylisocitrate lyase-like PEP mutase family enzyme [Variibacter gotjawalensis]RZS49847.1 2-methylisocitrate lyase-like PEP mutase family enzyme [Variibacter gotjawalensis]BAT57676.1 carboxyvinyl-carboxyphosphonate phosphorylmutase [Variibacter gotjawalensis]